MICLYVSENDIYQTVFTIELSFGDYAIDICRSNCIDFLKYRLTDYVIEQFLHHF